MSAIISPCGLYRYRLERKLPCRFMTDVGGIFSGKTIAFFGVNPSTADAEKDDATVRKLRGFCERWGAERFIVGNVFAYRATDIRELAGVDDPFGDDIGDHIAGIIDDADILVPCWGDEDKVPPKLRFAFDMVMDTLVASSKPVLCFGKTKNGYPRHPLMLPYITKLEDFS